LPKGPKIPPPEEHRPIVVMCDTMVLVPLYLAWEVRTDEVASLQLAASPAVMARGGLSLGPSIATLDRRGFAGPNTFLPEVARGNFSDRRQAEVRRIRLASTAGRLLP
jgi:hypothetical protein